MKWFWLMDSSGRCKSHALPETLSAAIIDDLQGRDFLIDYTTKETEEFCIDMPGMCMVDRSYHTFEIDGVSISIPSSEVSIFHEKLGRREERIADGKPYYKLHGWLCCIVFTPDQREQMLSAMLAALPECEAIESAENAEFNSRMDKINKDKVRVITKPRPVKHPKVES